MLLLSLGAVTARMLWSGGYGWFVQQRMFIPLVLATVVLLGFGVFEAIQGTQEERRNPESSRWSVAPAVGWLLLLPLLVLIAVAPTGLGAAAASRVEAFTPNERLSRFEPLDASAGPVDMRVYDFLERAVWDPDASLDGVTVRLEGLVVNDDRTPDGFMLTRFLVSCCAADGIPLQVALRGVDQTFEDDTWVVAEVVWRPPEVPYDQVQGTKIVEADVISLTVVPGTNDPYESPY